jgi:hypothetical protein
MPHSAAQNAPFDLSFPAFLKKIVVIAPQALCADAFADPVECGQAVG